MSEPHDELSTMLLQFEEQVAAALELPEKARARAFARLREAHPDQAALLERCELAAATLDPELRSVDELANAMRAAALAEAPERIGNFKILDVLGEGGMGVVYLADQQEPLRRRVALKVIKAGGTSRDVLARFEVERQSLALMDHPNIARVLDAGETDDGRPYFAMEHVAGVPINSFCDSHRLGLDARIELFAKVCHGVQHAHQKGVIHRDLKPSNILVASRDDLTEPKIIDFGVAKALQQRLTERTLYTEQGRILGTPEYMSPEQAEMSVVDVDTRSDIYSLGVLLYKLLAGVLPIDGRELRSGGYYEMQRRIREDEPPRPSTRVSTADAAVSEELAEQRRTDLHRLTDALRGELDWIVMRCLEKDPARRYQSASELQADLQRYLDGLPVLAGPPSAVYRFGKLLRRHRVAFAATGAALVALITGLSVAIWQYGVATDNAAQAGRAEQDAKDNLVIARTNADRAIAAEAQAQRELASSRALYLAAVSARALEQDPIDGLLLALAAVEQDENPETLGRVQTALAENHLVRRFPKAPSTICAVDYGARTRTVLQASYDGTIRLYGLDGGERLSLQLDERTTAARLSPDEQRLLTVSNLAPQRVIARAYDRSGRALAAVGDDARFTDIDWSPSGERLVVRRAEDGRVAICGVAGEVQEVLLASSTVPSGWRSPRRLGFTPEGHVVFVQPRQMRIWRDVAGEPTVLRLQPDESFKLDARFVPTRAVAFDPRGELLATRIAGDTPRLWSSAGERIDDLRGHTYSHRSLQFTADGDLILTGAGDGTARLWTRAGQQRDVIRQGGELIEARFLAADRRILTSNLEATALWSVSGMRLNEMRGTDGSRLAAAISRDELLLFNERQCSIWNLSGSTGTRLRGPYERPYQIALRPGGGILATSESGQVVAWSAAGALDRVFDSGSGKPTYGVAASPDGGRIVAGGVDGSLRCWDWSSRSELWRIDLPAGPLTHVYWLANGRLLAAASPSRTAFLVDPESGSHDVLMNRRTGACVWAFASPDGRVIALQSLDRGRIRFCNERGEVLTDFRAGGPEADGNDLAAWRIAFDRTGRWLGLACDGGEVSVWDLREVLSGKPDITPRYRRQHGVTAYGIDFSPDGSRFVAALDGSAYVADLDGNEQFRVWPRGGRLTGYLPPVARFTEDGEWLLGAAPDGVRRWPANKERLLRLAREFAARHGKDRDLDEYRELLDPPSGSQGSGR